jgi:hypothetical protein
MTIAFVLTIPLFAATAPAPSASFTPNAGDLILPLAITSDEVNAAITFTGTGSYSSIIQGNSASAASTAAIGANTSATGGAQTFTLSDAIAGFLIGTGVDYSGVTSLSNSASADLPTPGAGANAILGSSISVPTGSVLVAICWNASGVSDTITTTGTSRGSNASGTSYRIAEYVGAGASIQPTFTATGGATGNYILQQIMLNGVAPNSATIAWVS